MSVFNFDNQNNEDQFNDEEQLPQEDFMSVDFTTEDPDSLISRYFENIIVAKDEDELYRLLASFYNTVHDETYKEALMDDIQDKILYINELQNGE